jgi:hypothetical protein
MCFFYDLTAGAVTVIALEWLVVFSSLLVVTGGLVVVSLDVHICVCLHTLCMHAG